MAHCTECGNEFSGSEKFCGECGAPRVNAATGNLGRVGASDQRGVETLMGMARTAELGSNNAEALEYYNRVLEADPTIAQAWLGKGRSAAWQSTLANFRVSEALVAFQHAIATAGEDRQSAVDSAVDEINKIVSALYRMARAHMEEYASLDSTWGNYLGQVGQMLDALEQARSWSPHNRVVLENIIHLSKDNIEGYKYWDNIHRVSGVHGVSPQYEETLRDMLNRAVAGIRQMDDAYQAPTIEKKQSGACFVVTAAMGDASHPDVVALRKFRDQRLLNRSVGRFIVSWYYTIGPILAKKVAGSPLRRRIVYILIVRPCVKMLCGALR